MCVLTIDLGTKTGWALRSGHSTLSGTLDLKGGRFEGGGMRFLRFRGFLAEMHAKAPLKAIFYEEVRAHKGTDAAHIYGGFLAELTAFGEEHRIPYQGVPVQHIKRFITGKGNADKAAVIKAVRELGFNKVTDDNEADAISLLMLKLESPEVMTLV